MERVAISATQHQHLQTKFQYLCFAKAYMIFGIYSLILERYAKWWRELSYQLLKITNYDTLYYLRIIIEILPSGFVPLFPQPAKITIYSTSCPILTLIKLQALYNINKQMHS